MSRTAHKLLSASGGKAYEIEQSLMFNRADTPSLERTPSSAGNRRTWTFSAWIKRIKDQTAHAFFAAYAGSSGSDANWNWNAINNDDKLQVGGWNQNYRVTNRLFRDFGAWYHIVIAFDTTQGTAGDRVKVYVNGVEETSFSTSNNPDLNEELAINSTIEHQVGAANYTTRNCFDGYIAEAYLIDGSQLTASSFGETDGATSQWIPKKYTGSYGTNGFYLKFVSGAIGTDSSGNGNNYTASNLADSDVLLDTPTNNFCTLDNGDTGSYATLSQGALMSFGLLAALTKAKKTGVGQLVEVSMYDAIVSMCERAIYQFDLTNKITVINVRINKRKTVILLTIFSVLKIIINL